MTLSIAFAIDSVTFSAGVIAGSVSLGGSESACVGLARALQARGHRVSIFTTKLGEDAPRVDHAGVQWHPLDSITAWSLLEDFDVLVALRNPQLLYACPAKFRVLWNQDLMMASDEAKQHVMSMAWAVDAVAYVSHYHRKQWEGVLPELAPIGWVTRNGYDPDLVPGDVSRDPNRIIHITRPERGLGPLLAMWPRLRELRPQAELHLCRYSSMYDPLGFGQVCAEFDRMVAIVNAQVGGITYLGELGKPELYRAISSSAVMWYPGVSTFAETSCIAAIEAQACGTPFVGSWKGALPETVPSGVLIAGAAQSDPAYQAASLQAVIECLDGCAHQTVAYRRRQAEGRAHVRASYTYAVLAAEWDQWLREQFTRRYAANPEGVLAQLLYEDDHTLARVVAEEVGDTATSADCDRVIAGLEQGAEDYADRAIDPRRELAEETPRQKAVVQRLTGCRRVLDVACGSGAFALALLQADPTRTVVAIDYSPRNIKALTEAAEALGVADRLDAIAQPVWDLAGQHVSEWFSAFVDEHAAAFDGLWCGEFLEHVADAPGLIDTLEVAVRDDGRIVYSCPFGPMSALLPRTIPLKRGHVHHFRSADIRAVFGPKADLTCQVLPWIQTPNQEPCGQWMISYRVDPSRPRAGARPSDRRVLVRPRQPLTVAIITNQTTDLRRCLEAVWAIADEVLIGDCGAPADELDRILVEFPRKVRIIPIGLVEDLTDGFAEARNRLLDAATGAWYLWVDTDETLCGSQDVAKYLHSQVFHGFAIKQQHLQLDAPMATDTPIRLFRIRPDVRFYGCVHEQPQMGTCNGDIVPALKIDDVQIAHLGYLHEGIRRSKALVRNLPLLIRDQERFPDRELGKVLVLRDYANLALWAREKAGGSLSEESKRYYQGVIALFEAHFMSPSHRYHAIARPYYEQALPHVASAIEVEIAVTACRQGLRGARAVPSRAWVRTPDHLKQLTAHRLQAMADELEQQAKGDTVDVEPIAAPSAVEVGA